MKKEICLYFLKQRDMGDCISRIMIGICKRRHGNEVYKRRHEKGSIPNLVQNILARYH